MLPFREKQAQPTITPPQARPCVCERADTEQLSSELIAWLGNGISDALPLAMLANNSPCCIRAASLFVATESAHALVPLLLRVLLPWPSGRGDAGLFSIRSKPRWPAGGRFPPLTFVNCFAGV